MQAALKQIVTLLEADSALQTLLGGSASDRRIYPAFPDSLETFPCVVYSEIDSRFRTTPSNVEDTTIQFNIYSKTTRQAIEDIVTRINAVLNYYNQVGNKPRIRYVILQGKTDLDEPDRRLFAKALTYQLWIQN